MGKISRGLAVAAGLVAGLMAVSAVAAEIVKLDANGGRFYIQGGFYPNYVLFLKGLPEDTATEWADQSYKAIMDIHDGPEAGQSVLMLLKPTTEESPNPQWCKTEGGERFAGQGLTCLVGFDDYREQLRFMVDAQWADFLAEYPDEFQDRTIAEYPELPGRRELEELGNFTLHIIKD